MRRRLLFSTLAVAVTAVLLFGVPLAFVLSQLQVTVAQDQVQRDATTLAKTLENRVRSGVPASLTDAQDAARSLPDRYVSITQDGGLSYHTGTLPPRGSAIIGRAVTKDFRVIVEADRAVSNERGKLALVISLAGLAVAVAVALAIIQARRLTRPLQELAEAAGRRFGGGGPARAKIRHTGAGPSGRGPGRVGGADQRAARGRARVRRGRLPSAPDPADCAVHAAGGDPRGRRPARGGARGGDGGAVAGGAAHRRGQPVARPYPPVGGAAAGRGVR